MSAALKAELQAEYECKAASTKAYAACSQKAGVYCTVELNTTFQTGCSTNFGLASHSTNSSLKCKRIEHINFCVCVCVCFKH